jgi:hypothetical protein
LLALIAVVTAPRAASAATSPRVLYLGADPELSRALEVALGPWGVTVVATRDTPPENWAAAGELATVVDADALVWIATVSGGPALHVYDRTVQQLVLVVRPLDEAPPYDAPAAAAVALTVKTVLRLGRVAPAEERVAVTDGAWRSRRPTNPRWRVDSALGSRIAGDDAELRSTIGLTWSPGGGRLGLGATVALGPGVAVDVPEFAGRHTGTGFAAAAHWRFPSDGVFFEPALGLTVSRATLDGVALGSDVRAHVVRWNPGAVAQLALGARTGHVELALVGAAGLTFRRQRFLLDGDLLYEVPALDWHLGLRLSVMIP